MPLPNEVGNRKRKDSTETHRNSDINPDKILKTKPNTVKFKKFKSRLFKTPSSSSRSSHTVQLSDHRIIGTVGLINGNASSPADNESLGKNNATSRYKTEPSERDESKRNRSTINGEIPPDDAEAKNKSKESVKICNVRIENLNITPVFCIMNATGDNIMSALHSNMPSFTAAISEGVRKALASDVINKQQIEVNNVNIIDAAADVRSPT